MKKSETRLGIKPLEINYNIKKKLVQIKRNLRKKKRHISFILSWSNENDHINMLRCKDPGFSFENIDSLIFKNSKKSLYTLKHSFVSSEILYKLKEKEVFQIKICNL